MSHTVVRAAVVQMVSTDIVEANLIQAETLLAQAAEQSCQLVVLPENFAIFGGRDLQRMVEDEQQPGPILRFLASAAKRYGLWIIAGSAPLSDNANTAKVFASCTVWSPEGVCVARYDKMHLFDVDVADSVGRYRESDQYAPGDLPVCVTTPWAVVGLSICYDLRFPELYRQLSQQGAKILSVPSAFTYQTGEVHWEVLLRARAIENQCFVLAANQGGHHGNNRVTWGHSCIIDPWGDILAMSRDSGSAVIWADIDFTRQQKIRQAMPVLRHRRLMD